MAEAIPLSCCIIAKNEADRIARTVSAASAVCAEVLVVDSGSTDGTPEAAAQAGARVLHRTWDGYGPQKRFAEASAAHDWVLSLDADEVLSPELQAEIAATMRTGPAFPGYRMRIVDVYAGETRPRPRAPFYELVRLYDRRVFQYSDSPVHDRVVTDDRPLGRFDGPVLHYSWRSLQHLREKMLAYAEFQAGKMNKRPAGLIARLPFEYPLTFLKYYLGRGHVFGGLTGLRISHMTAEVRTLRLLKLLARGRAEAVQ